MKTIHIRGVFWALLISIVTPCISASGQTASLGTRVGVIDINYIFKNHPGFKAAMDEMKTEVEAFENTLRARGNQIKELQAKLQQYNPSSSEYKQTEVQILEIQADGQTAAALKKKEFLQRETRIYFDTYNDVCKEVARFSEQHGFGLIVRFSSESVNPDDRRSVLEGVNRAVVYQKKLNVTFAILEQLKRNAVAAGGGATPPAKR